MAQPASLLERLPALVRRGEPLGSREERAALPFGIPAIDEVLPDGGLPRGAVVELAIHGGLALGTTLALASCRSVQEEAARYGGEPPWCAFVDPSGTLHGPGAAEAGVRLERLLVVRPELGALERTAIRLAESQAFAVVVVDVLGVPGAPLGVLLGGFPRVIRRLALAVEESGSVALLLTDAEARRPLPLPVAMRLELARPEAERLTVRVAKERRGRVSGPRSVVWAKPRAKPLVIVPERQSMPKLEEGKESAR